MASAPGSVYLSRKQVRALDASAIEDFGIPSLVLMENAGRGAADWLCELADGPVLVVCGKGNNAGDGFVVARHLDQAGLDVRVATLFEPESLSGDALANLKIIERASIPTISDLGELHRNLEQVPWIVDGILGTGARGTLTGVVSEVIESMNGNPGKVFALDLPTGFDCDSGEILGTAVRCRYTATFVAPKSGFASLGSGEYTGEVRVLPIGVPGKLLARYGIDRSVLSSDS